MDNLRTYIVSEYLKLGGHVRLVLNDNYDPCPLFEAGFYWTAICLKGVECMEHYPDVPVKEHGHLSIIAAISPWEYEVINSWDDFVRLSHRILGESQNSMRDFKYPSHVFIKDYERLGLTTNVKELVND